MKLYTEKELRKHLYNHDERFFNELTPIQLPSDEEIEKKSKKLPFEVRVNDDMYNEGINEGFFLGVEFIQQKILNQINMKPDEIAKDLFVKNIELIPDYIKRIDAKHIAKECALIAVDEIISVLTDLNAIYNITPALTYWQEVKKEIENI
jgi:hypothetical protein